MDKIKNWALTILLSLGGYLDFALGITRDFWELLGFPENSVKYVQMTIAVVGFIILKLQTPTKKSAKLQKIVNTMASNEEKIVGSRPTDR